MTKEEAIEELRKLKYLARGDAEAAHSKADSVLCELLSTLGYEDVVKAYDEIQPKWYV